MHDVLAERNSLQDKLIVQTYLRSKKSIPDAAKEALSTYSPYDAEQYPMVWTACRAFLLNDLYNEAGDLLNRSVVINYDVFRKAKIVTQESLLLYTGYFLMLYRYLGNRRFARAYRSLGNRYSGLTSEEKLTELLPHLSSAAGSDNLMLGIYRLLLSLTNKQLIASVQKSRTNKSTELKYDIATLRRRVVRLRHIAKKQKTSLPRTLALLDLLYKLIIKKFDVLKLDQAVQEFNSVIKRKRKFDDAEIVRYDKLWKVIYKQWSKI
jgi:hypothetical protein